MTSVAKDRTRLRRINPNQNHNKHHTPGVIINYLCLYCIHILSFHLLFYYVIIFYLIFFMYTIIPGVRCLL